MNVIDAAYATVHDYPGGSESLAPRLGMSAAVLRNKVNPHCATHHLTLAEAERMLTIAGDLRVLQALAASAGFGLVALPVADDGGADLLSAALDEHAATGELAAVLRAAQADGVITPREAATITSAGLAVQAAVMTLVSRVDDTVRRPRGVAA